MIIGFDCHEVFKKPVVFVLLINHFSNSSLFSVDIEGILKLPEQIKLNTISLPLKTIMIKQPNELNHLLNQASQCPNIFDDIQPELRLEGSFSMEFFIFYFLFFTSIQRREQ